METRKKIKIAVITTIIISIITGIYILHLNQKIKQKMYILMHVLFAVILVFSLLGIYYYKKIRPNDAYLLQRTTSSSTSSYANETELTVIRVTPTPTPPSIIVHRPASSSPVPSIHSVNDTTTSPTSSRPPSPPSYPRPPPATYPDPVDVTDPAHVPTSPTVATQNDTDTPSAQEAEAAADNATTHSSNDEFTEAEESAAYTDEFTEAEEASADNQELPEAEEASAHILYYL